MASKKRIALAGVGAFGVAAVLASAFVIHAGTGAQAASNGGGNNGTTMTMKLVGTGSISASGSTTTSNGDTNKEIGPSTDEQIPRSATIVHTSAAGVPNPAGNSVTTTNPGLSGFNGLTHADQRLAGTGAYAGTQFSLEPPDQGLCEGNGYVLEGVNTALRVYDTSGTALTPPVAINQFLGLAPEINRSTLTYGDFTSDPKCYYDPDTQHWFFTVLQADVNSSTGAFTGPTHVYIAVSQTNDPTKKFNVFVIDTTNDGTDGTPKHAGCPCLGDQPLIGADANGFYVTTNEFPQFSNGFNGAQVYAMSKTALEKGGAPTVVTINAGAIPTPDTGGLWYSLQPATTPAGDSYASNTEYFLSALQFSSKQTLDNRIAEWTLTGTSTLNSSSPSISLTPTVVNTEVYGQPPASQQENGPTPLAASVHSPLEYLDSGDDRMQFSVYANGQLWGALNTVVQTPNGPTRTGIAYFVFNAASNTLAGQGYVSVNQENTIYPTIAVNSAGKALMTFTLVGQDYYPSAAYTTVDPVNGAGAVHIAAAGAGPDDGFTAYKAYGGGGTARWGDYSAAVADADGSFWLAQEYIPNAPRTLLANWGTYISHVTP